MLNHVLNATSAAVVELSVTLTVTHTQANKPETSATYTTEHNAAPLPCQRLQCADTRLAINTVAVTSHKSVLRSHFASRCTATIAIGASWVETTLPHRGHLN